MRCLHGIASLLRACSACPSNELKLLRVGPITYFTVFLAEFPDKTMLATAGLLVRFDDPVAVAIAEAMF